MARVVVKHGRILFVLVAVLAIALAGLAVWTVGRYTAVGPDHGGSRQTDWIAASAATSSLAPTPTPMATRQPSTEPAGETTYQTPEGLRFVDETTYEQELRSAQTLRQEEQVLGRFAGEYGMTMLIESGTPSWYAKQDTTWDYLTAGDSLELRTYAALFIDEWAKYPRAWVRASRVTTIALVKDLVVSGAARYAMPDPFGKALYLDVGAADASPAQDYDYARGVIHHEFDHDIEYDVFKSYSRIDATWTSYNPKGFKYGGGGITWYDGKPHVNTNHPEAGFVDAYATTGIEEDKAETYAYLFVDNRYYLLEVWIAKDPELAGKVAEYKAFIKSEVPFMDDAYFEAINP